MQFAILKYIMIMLGEKICNFIKTYDKDLKPFIKKDQGKMYIEGSGM